MKLNDVGALKPKFIAGFAVSVLLIVVLGIITARSFASLNEARSWVEHTNEVIKKVLQVQKLVIDIETGERGFLLTGDESFLAPYNDGKTLLEARMDEVQDLAKDNPRLVYEFELITALIARWYEEAAGPEIEARTQGSPEEQTSRVATLIKSATGKHIIDELRQRLGVVVDAEHQLMTQRKEATSNALRQTRNAIVAVLVMSVILVIVMFVLLLRTRPTPATSLLESQV